MSRFSARRWRAAIGVSALMLVLVGGVAPASAAELAPAAHSAGEVDSFDVFVPDAPGSDTMIPIDVDLYLPATSKPAPAVLLAHGFGGSKQSVAGDAKRLQGEGYVVLAYSARGFGRSGGSISLDSLDYEVADAKQLVGVLADSHVGGDSFNVERRNGKPVIGVVGASYGGALALMLGATDPRIDTVVAAITWNDLAQALVPQSAATLDSPSEPGVFKQAWAAQLFGAAASPFDGPCGRFTPQLCTLYTKLVGGGQLDADDKALLAASSPDSVLSGMTAPTLLLQGRQDTLFGFDQADANARQIRAAGAEVKVAWFAGGHDSNLTGGTSATVDDWLSSHLSSDTQSQPSAAHTSAAGAKSAEAKSAGAEAKAARPSAQEPFQFTVPTSSLSFAETRIAKSYPGLEPSAGLRTLPLRGRFNIITNPPGAVPATITSLPGTGPLDSVIGGVASAVTGTTSRKAQVATYTTAPIASPFILVGSPTVTVDVGLPNFRRRGQPATPPAAAPVEVVLFAQLRDTSGGSNVAVGGGVEPVRVTLPADGSMIPVTFTLPATTWRFESGDAAQLSVSTTDAGYQGSPTPATVVLRNVGGISFPTVASTDPTATAGAAPTGDLIAIPIVLLLGLALAIFAVISDRRRDRAAPPRAATADDAPPLVIRGLSKNYRSGFRAVDDLTFTVERGQVLGLLGPNGAGKTTALRMVTGLLRPDAGEVEIFGERVTPGSRVLTRVGCFIEGPGFLPHLSGRRNLKLFWAASGRPAKEARIAEALAIADLGTSVNRRVGGYSQGMKQRLAIAQAMLGMPELLILDEPTNGLDPPQIFALRGVLRRYAESGRTVIVSSHLLGEVEQTCSDVVVMARGRLVAKGTVAELAGETNELTIEVTDAAAAVLAVERLDGAEASITAGASITAEGSMAAEGTIRVLPAGHAPEDVVAAIAGAGVGIRSVARGRHLEETFLAMVGTEGII